MVQIGVVGLGNMGLPMAKNLLEDQLVVYGADLNQTAEAELERMGGNVGKSVAELAQFCDFVITSLPSSQAVESVYLGGEGLMNYASEDIVLIDTSTVSPALNQLIEKEAIKKGISYLAAPVSGGVIGAVGRTLTFMVGGEQGSFLKAKPIMERLGANIFHVAESIESGTNTKLMNNLLIGFYTAGVAETLNLAKRSGLDLDKLFDILNVSYGQSRIYERNYKSFIANDEYVPGFSLKLLIKDIGFALESAVEKGVSLPISNELLAMYKEIDQAGYGDMDMSVIYKAMDQQVQINE